jgi:hemoglobin
MRSPLSKTSLSLPLRIAIVAAVALLQICFSGCRTGPSKTQQDKAFFTSGSRDADQRAQQRMAKSQQLKSQSASSSQGPATTNAKPSLYKRLGGDEGISAIVDDFINRAMADPRVNWDRKGVIHGGIFTLHHAKPMQWNASPENVKKLKLHMSQFFALATGGPSNYQGKEMHAAHADMHITNAQYDAAVGDLKASMDNLRIASQEQKELLAIVESARPEIVQER